MDQNGQLTFSDDPFLMGSNEVYQLIEQGSFSEAVQKLDKFMDENPDYPGFIEGYRTARFWENRVDGIKRMNRGKQTADYLMREWEQFEIYAKENDIIDKTAFKSVMKYVFFTASEHYKIAFQEQESTADNFNLLINLGYCFITLEEYQKAIETLEYAGSTNKNNAKLLSLLGEAYFNVNEPSKSLLYFREAFFIDPSEIDLNNINAKPIKDIVRIINDKKPEVKDIREWIPVFGYLEDIFFVRRNLYTDQVESIKHEIYNLEKNFQTMNKEKIKDFNLVPRLINKYIWMLDYFINQEDSPESAREVKDRLKAIDFDVFDHYFPDPGSE